MDVHLWNLYPFYSGKLVWDSYSILWANFYSKDSLEIFFLGKEEIRKLAFEKYSDEELNSFRVSIDSRKSEFIKYGNVTPTTFIQGSREFNDPPPNVLDQKFHDDVLPISSKLELIDALGDKHVLEAQAGQLFPLPLQIKKVMFPY